MEDNSNNINKEEEIFYPEYKTSFKIYYHNQWAEFEKDYKHISFINLDFHYFSHIYQKRIDVSIGTLGFGINIIIEF